MNDEVFVEELTELELEQAFAEVEEVDPSLPDEIDGVPFAISGDFEDTGDEPEENPETPPFNIEAALEGVTFEE
ncbi:hypothetical protein [Nodosilinea sp. FACHB-13]|uniref:hypothetical protein n=1 Tax=Cyanophyceae TaxID=3028117 RepID=UPI001683335B|nr:hypothetical protein [Nodosilinea sp. FACHB-13]MBD2109318.1 hypothetical protein [Nodosilinea sp. FACHB-13]